MCDCYETTKKRLVDHMTKQLPEGAQEMDLELQGYLFGFGDHGMTHRSSNAVKVTYMAPKKSKAGGMKRVVVNTFIRATFCPFCGVNYEKADQAERDEKAKAGEKQ